MIRQQTCPVCEAALSPSAGADSSVFPFCSQRCQEIDMYRWCEGRYAIIEPIDPDQLQGEEHDDAQPD